KAVARNLAFSFALYSGQMCTAPQNIYVPKDGIQTDEGHLSFDEVCAALGQAVERLCSAPERAVEITGALQNDATAARIQQAKALGLEVIVDSQPLAHPVYPEARTATPLLLKTEATNPQIMQEWFGPIIFVVATDSTEHSIQLAGETVREHGALTLSAYTTDATTATKVRKMAERS